MSARSRLKTGARHDQDSLGREQAIERWHRAAEIRDEWLACGLSTERSDRGTAEAAISELYALAGEPPPRFEWVDSPRAAIDLLAADPPTAAHTGELVRAIGGKHVAVAIADMSHRLRQRYGLMHGREARWFGRWDTVRLARSQLPEEALRLGAGLVDVIDVGVHDALEQTFHDAIRRPLQAALTAIGGPATQLCWYGHLEAPWIAAGDIRRRIGFSTFSETAAHQLGLWAALVRSCGWWWPDQDRCIVSERPTVVHTEADPGAMHGELRTHNAHGSAIEFADGWGVHVWHGTYVPAWVIDDPSIERILTERNVEIRRCAIEAIGWDAYIRGAGLDLVATAPDPGNPGCELHLYDMPRALWGGLARVLLAVNGSVERDGHRRRYGLSVPADIDDPISAAGWSYGLSGSQYAQLLRRT